MHVAVHFETPPGHQAQVDFAEWGEIFGDEVMAAALIDRLVHHCHIVNIRGNSYRLKNHAEPYNARRTPGARRATHDAGLTTASQRRARTACRGTPKTGSRFPDGIARSHSLSVAGCAMHTG